MNILNISKKDREVTVTLSSDELVKICNVFYNAETNRNDLFYQLYSDMMVARNLSQYGHIDSFCLRKIVECRNKCVTDKRGEIVKNVN